jgi:tetratricopeptide (TPR) repeat protein
MVESEGNKAEQKGLQANDALRKGLVEKSIELYTEAFELEAGANILTNRAIAYMQQYKYHKALADCEKAL